MLQCDCDGLSVFILKEAGSSDSSGPNSTPNGNFFVKGTWWRSWGFAAYQFRKLCLLTVPCKLHCASSLIRSLFRRSGFSITIPWKWRQNCKRTSLSRSLQECTVCNCMGEDSGYYAGCAKHSCQTCLTLVRAYLQTASDCGWRTPTFGQRSEDGRPGGFLHAIEPSSRHCLTHWRIAFGGGASCRFISWRNPRWVFITDPIRIYNSTAHTHSASPQRSMSTNFECHCFR